jgi:Uri superfamily endonuclease
VKTIISGKKECEVSRILEKVAKKGVKGFGCSDCKCKSHFHYFGNENGFEKVLEMIKMVQNSQ